MLRDDVYQLPFIVYFDTYFSYILMEKELPSQRVLKEQPIDRDGNGQGPFQLKWSGSMGPPRPRRGPGEGPWLRVNSLTSRRKYSCGKGSEH